MQRQREPNTIKLAWNCWGEACLMQRQCEPNAIKLAWNCWGEACLMQRYWFFDEHERLECKIWQKEFSYHTVATKRKKEKWEVMFCRYQLFSLYLHTHYGSVVQLNRMQDSGSWDRGFESRRSHQFEILWNNLKRHERIKRRRMTINKGVSISNHFYMFHVISVNTPN